MKPPPTPNDAHSDAVWSHEPKPIEEVRKRLSGRQAWLVGGAVRDLILGRPLEDIDVAVASDPAGAAAAISSDARVHERFGTATAQLGEMRVDLALTRAERYPNPGSLPEIQPAAITDDLARRDFTVNAMAVPLEVEPALLDPHGGARDLADGVIRVLHPRSFSDDPTRALRAAMYAARLGFELDAETERLARQADLSTVTTDRVLADMRRIVEEDTAPGALGLLSAWGLAGVDADAGERVAAARELLADPAWADAASRTAVLMEAALPSPEAQSAAGALASESPSRPSQIAALARGCNGVDLAAARLAGAIWLDQWVGGLDRVKLEIDGDDLIAAGVAAGPAVGRGLAAAMAARLDGEAPNRETQLQVALAEAT